MKTRDTIYTNHKLLFLEDQVMLLKNYNRTTFWTISLITIFVGSFVLVVSRAAGYEVFRLFVAFVINLILIITLANRIRDYGSNAWLALLAIIPFVGMFQALYYGIRHKKPKIFHSGTTQRSQSASHKKFTDEHELKRYNYHQENKEDTWEQGSSKQAKPLKRLT